MDNTPPRGLRAWLAHAFAIEANDESSLTPEERAILEGLARRIHERHWTTPAIFWLQTNRHMNWLGAQVMVVAEPIYDMAHGFLKPLLQRFGIYVPPEEMPLLIATFEKRYSIEYFTQQLEALQAETAGGPMPTYNEPDEA